MSVCVYAQSNYACLCVSHVLSKCVSVWEIPRLHSSITVCGDPWEQTGLWTCLAASGMLKVATQHCLRTGGAAGFNYGSVLGWETANFHSHISSLVTFSHCLLHGRSLLPSGFQLCALLSHLFLLNPFSLCLAHSIHFHLLSSPSCCFCFASFPMSCQLHFSPFCILFFCFAVFLLSLLISFCIPFHPFFLSSYCWPFLSLGPQKKKKLTFISSHL